MTGFSRNFRSPYERWSLLSPIVNTRAWSLCFRFFVSVLQFSVGLHRELHRAHVSRIQNCLITGRNGRTNIPRRMAFSTHNLVIYPVLEPFRNFISSSMSQWKHNICRPFSVNTSPPPTVYCFICMFVLLARCKKIFINCLNKLLFKNYKRFASLNTSSPLWSSSL